MIGILNPLGLLALASIGVLVALTLFARRTRIMPVSSLLLWKQIPARPVERQRFSPDLLFVLRALLLLALAIGYLRPYVVRPRAAERRRPRRRARHVRQHAGARDGRHALRPGSQPRSTRSSPRYPPRRPCCS